MTTLTKVKIISKSQEAEHIEKIVAQILKVCKSKKVKVSNPVHLPNIHLRITARKSPCGEGSGTINHYYKVIRTKLLYLESLHALAFISPEFLDEHIKIKIG